MIRVSGTAVIDLHPANIDGQFLGWYFDDEFTQPFNLTEYPDAAITVYGTIVPIN